MTDAARLLIALQPSEPVRATVRRVLGAVPFAFASESGPDQWNAVEAMLVGSLEREIPEYHSPMTPRLQFVQQVYTGLDEFDFALFPETVRVAGNVGGFAPFVAEQAVALLLASAKNIVGFDRVARAGTLRPVPPTKSLRGRTALILGFGAIAQETARRLAAFGVRIVGMSRTGAPHPLAERMVDPTRLAEAVASADFVVDCLPLTRRTRHLIDASVLRQMKEDAILVNVGRADTIQPEALADHLRAHPRFQAALDVTWGEDFGTGRIELSPSLAGLSNLVLSPHIAGYSEGAREYALERAVENLANFFSGRPLAHVAERADYAREV